MNEGFIFSVGGGGAALPVVSFAPAALAAGAASGSAAGQASCSGGHSGAWSISTTAPLAVNASTGAVTTTGAVSQGSYSATLVYTFASGGETYAVSETISVTVGAAPVAAPTVTMAPSLSTNSPVVGAAITPTEGVYTGSPTITAQWFYADTGSLISGAPTSPGQAYTPVSGDVGHTLKYIETATNSAGSVASAAPTTSGVQAAASHTADQTSTTADRTALTADAA